jgi:hypothetical protein
MDLALAVSVHVRLIRRGDNGLMEEVPGFPQPYGQNALIDWNRVKFNHDPRNAFLCDMENVAETLWTALQAVSIAPSK